MQRIRAEANPDILQWARQQRRSSLETVAKKLAVKPETLRDAEDGIHKLTMSQLRKLAEFYKRPLAGFFLQRIPNEFQLPDFRNLNLEKSNYEDIEPVIRSVLTKKSDATNLYNMLNLHYDYHFVNSCKVDMPIDKIALKIENELKIDKNELSKLKKGNLALKYWRSAIEKLGILVFQFSRIKSNVTRGFSFSDIPFPTIAINRANSPYARIFTMAHEMAHIFLNEPGICTNYQNAVPDTQIEVICNKVAAKLLVPDEEVKSLASGKLSNKADIEELILELSEKFKVSYTVIVIKLSELNLIDEKLKGELYPPQAQQKKRGFPPPSIDFHSKTSENFIKFVYQALDSGIINDYQAISSLDIKLENLDKFRPGRISA